VLERLARLVVPVRGASLATRCATLLIVSTLVTGPRVQPTPWLQLASGAFVLGAVRVVEGGAVLLTLVLRSTRVLLAILVTALRVSVAATRAAPCTACVVVPGRPCFHELEAFSVLHRRSILDRLDVLLVVQGHIGGVQIQEVTNLV